MNAPFQLIWLDGSGNVLPAAVFPIAFPGTTSPPQLIQLRSNAAVLQTYETLVGVSFFLVGDTDDINTVQNLWPTLGGVSQSGLNGGYDISFDSGRTFIRFDPTHGVQGNQSSWIELPAEAIGSQGTVGVLGAFDTAHLIVRVVVPPGATQYQSFAIQLGVDFDII
jgi:hypothetical protein